MANKSKTMPSAMVKFPESKALARKFFTSSHETALLPNLIEVQLISLSKRDLVHLLLGLLLLLLIIHLRELLILSLLPMMENMILLIL